MTTNKKNAKARKPSRKYPQRTVSLLFGRSSNQCAYPDCTNPLIEGETEKSEAQVVAHICHIYAFSQKGPRGKAGLTPKERDAPENLILLCQHHHAIVDKQHETYTAEMLKEWKQRHEAKMQTPPATNTGNLLLDFESHPRYPRRLIDQKIDDEVTRLRKSRFFPDFDQVQASLALANKLLDGELAGGTDEVRGRALAWCARFIAPTDHLDKAQEYLKVARQLADSPEVAIGGAFIASQKGDRGVALSALADIDTALSRSAALLVVMHHDGPQEAVRWLTDTGLQSDDLDPDGKHVLLARYFDLGSWDAAKALVDALRDEDFLATPVLYRMAAMAHLLTAVPSEVRDVVLSQVPFDAADFRLASDAAALEARRAAHDLFVDATAVAQQMDCVQSARHDDEYALWLELVDPEMFQQGRQRLEDKLRDRKSGLRVVYLALQFGIEVDLQAVERDIAQTVTLNGGMTLDAALARFALAFAQGSPELKANYIGRYHDELADFIDTKLMRFCQIQFLAHAGQPKKAAECLELIRDSLSASEERRIRHIIAEAEGTDPVEARKDQFRSTDFLGDLASLVELLDSREKWEELCEYGAILFDRTGSVPDAERVTKGLSKTWQHARLVEFVEQHPDIAGQSMILQMQYCWSLYYEGELLKARAELVKLQDDTENPNYRALQLNLGIALGDWNSLAAIVAKESREKHRRTAADLIRTAKLAFEIGSPSARELLFAAARKADHDAGILASAYFLASRAGWEDDREVFQWLHEAASLSGDYGPIQKMSLKDVLDRKPDWDRRESEVWELLRRGDIPMFLAGQSLNKSLIHLMLLPAHASLSEEDPRLRSIIPAYSGKRQPVHLDLGGTVALDATALLTLSFLGLLDEALDAFDQVHLAHSTLFWLFAEKQQASFHQPSRVEDARQVRQLLATNILAKFLPSVVAPSDLSAQVGDELAALIAEAERPREGDDTQRLVVRPYPVHRLGSLMDEEADLTAHAEVLSGCQAIVNKLRENGQVTSEQHKKACDYLKLHEKQWPSQPDISDNAVLYLDDLAITYLLHLDMLDKLRAAGFEAIASPREEAEVNELLAYNSLSTKVNTAIEHIRSALHKRIEEGKNRIGRQGKSLKEGDADLSDHPTVGTIGLAEVCDAVISDDRFINQHANIEEGDARAHVYTTLDLIDALANAGAITSEDRLEHRTLLRRGGYAFITLDDTELTEHLESSTIRDGKVIETAELKAIRENALKVRMTTWLNLPREAGWLDALLKCFIRVLRSMWKPDADTSVAIARSDWILKQLDVRGWAHRLGGENADNLVKIGHGAHLLILLRPLDNVPAALNDEYWAWIEDRFLGSIKEEDPDLYAWLIEMQRRDIAYIVEHALPQEGTDEE